MPKWTVEQQLAIDEEGKNIIVSAGAGSGKTAVLSERVLRKLKNGVNIDKLLILTFTNAAASEMKDRIRKKIKKEDSLKRQLDYLDRAYITTFDSYALSIVKKYHYLLNVSSNINIVDSGIILLETKKIIDEIFMELYEKEDKLFLNLINDFCIKDDNIIKDAIININASLNLKNEKEEYLKKYLDNFYSKDKIESHIKEYTALLIKKIKNIETILYDISSTEFTKFYEEISTVLEPLIKSNSYDEIKDKIEIKLPRRPKDSEDLEPLKENINKLLKEIKELLRYDNLDEIYETFTITKSYVECILNIILEYDKRISEFKAINDTYSFTDIALLAIKIVKENKDIRSEIKDSYNEIMIDEYQDTNDLQEAFINMIENNNVYMVGDIKQSIYRFRNANPDIFKEKYSLYSKDNGGTKIDLLKNFRSRDEVLAGINSIFDLIMDNEIGGADYSLSHRMQFGNSAYTTNNKETQNSNLEILNYNSEDKKYSKEELEAFIIVNDIKVKIENKYQVFDKEKEILRDITYEDFCIIMDRGTSFELYKKIFEHNQVPLVLFKDETLTSETDIIIIKNILGLIIKIYKKEYDSEFKYYFYSIARSFLMNIKDNEIFDIIKNNNYYDTTLYKLCKSISDNLDTLSCTKILDMIIENFKIYENIILIGGVEESIIRIENLMDIAKNLSNIGYTPIMFKEYISNMIDSKEEIRYSVNNKVGNNVKIMNIHKSKGLEFPICYFSGYHKRFNTMDIKDRFIFDNKYGVITPYFKEGIGTLILKDLVKEKYNIEMKSEQIRLFYVALTRAREKMIIVTDINAEGNEFTNDIVSNDIRIKYQSFLDIILSTKENIKSFIKNVDFEMIPLTKNYNITKEVDYKILIEDTKDKITYEEIKIENKAISNKHASKTLNKLITIKEKENMEYGNKMHQILEMMDFANQNINEKIISNLISNLDDMKKAKIYKEHEFIYSDSKTEYHGIIDLLIEYEDHFKIIDYKLKNISDEEYIKQLKTYSDYIKTISNKKIYTYLYSIIDNKFEEIK